MPWSTSFEDGLCGYHSVGGFCYARNGASIEIVESPPAHVGKFSAAFTVNADATTDDRSQARCVREGVMPRSAYYGAWYRIPSVHSGADNWNLFHFLGFMPDGTTQPLWDVSLTNNQKGGLQLAVFNSLRSQFLTVSVDSIPIDQWFHIEMQLVRSAQANGEVTVYQDDIAAAHVGDVQTDPTERGQWFVGNYAKIIVPSLSTIYVDDISIGEQR